ncbi:MAG: aspartyl protease family protein [Cytophagales bacterium]
MRRILFNQFHFVFFTLILFLFSSCSLEYYLKKGKVESRNFSKSLKFEYPNHLIIVNAKIAGKERRFLFDSGAPNVISKELQEELQYKVKLRNGTKDSQGVRHILDFVYIDEIEIAGVTVSKTIAAVSDLNASEEIKCLNIDGIMGANLMAKLNWEIDYQKRIIHFSDSRAFEDQNQADIKLGFNPDFQKTPKIKLGLGSEIKNNITFDLGSNGGVHLKPEDLMNTFKQVKSYGWVNSALFGSAFDTVYFRYTNPLLMGNSSLGPYWIKCSENSSRTIGNRVWDNFKVQLNYKDKVIYLHRQKDIQPSKEEFGFKLKYRNGQWIIATVIIESQAYDYGLRPGDKVLELNEFNLSDADFEDYCEQFLSESLIPSGNDLRIKVLSGIDEEVLELELFREEFFTF